VKCCILRLLNVILVPKHRFGSRKVGYFGECHLGSKTRVSVPKFGMLWRHSALEFNNCRGNQKCKVHLVVRVLNIHAFFWVLLALPCAGSSTGAGNPVTFATDLPSQSVTRPDRNSGEWESAFSPLIRDVGLVLSQHDVFLQPQWENLGLLLDSGGEVNSTWRFVLLSRPATRLDSPGSATDTQVRWSTPRFLLVVLIIGAVVRFFTSDTYLNFLSEVFDPKAY
jgi:hypothetical protein